MATRRARDPRLAERLNARSRTLDRAVNAGVVLSITVVLGCAALVAKIAESYHATTHQPAGVSGPADPGPQVAPTLIGPAPQNQLPQGGSNGS